MLQLARKINNFFFIGKSILLKRLIIADLRPTGSCPSFAMSQICGGTVQKLGNVKTQEEYWL